MGFFSWMTQDTNRSIANHYSGEPVFTVYMMDDKGNSWREDNYEGYGEFDGKDYYELLDEMNGGGGDRDAGIELRHGMSTLRNVHTGEILDKTWFNWRDEIVRDNMSANELIETGDWEQYTVKPLEVRYPNFVEDPDWVWRNDQPEDCEFQGFFYDAESDDNYCDECGEMHDGTEGCSWQRCLDCDTELGEKRPGCQSHYEICAVCCDCCCNVCGDYLQSTPGANQYNWCMCAESSSSDSKNAEGESMSDAALLDKYLSDDSPDQLTDDEYDKLPDEWVDYTEAEQADVIREIIAARVDQKDAETRTFDAPKATNRTTGKTWIQMRNMDDMPLINLMDRTHPSWGVKKGLMKATTKKKFADAMAKSATGWIDASIIKENVGEYLDDVLKSGPNKGKVKMWNQGKWIYVPNTTAAITKFLKRDIAAANKWCKDKAKLKGLNTYSWKTWSPYFWRFHRGGGSSDIFTAMGLAGWDKHTLWDLKRAMMAMDIAEQGKTVEYHYKFETRWTPAKAKATMKAYGMTPPANIGKAPPKPKAKAKSSGSKTSKRKGMARRKAKPKSRSSDVKKRKGPNTSATSFNLGTRKKGNDGKMWTVKRSGKSKRWVRGAEEAGDGRTVVQWEDAQGLSSPSGQPSNIKWAETEWLDDDGDDVDLSLSHPIKDGAYVAIGLGLGTVALAIGFTAFEILISRLRD